MPSTFGPVAVNVNTGALEYSSSGYEAAGSVSTHEADTTSVHGITDTAQVALKNTAQTLTAIQTLTAGELQFHSLAAGFTYLRFRSSLAADRAQILLGDAIGELYIDTNMGDGGGDVIFRSGAGSAERLRLLAGGPLELPELSADPTAPAANKVRFYAKDNGSGKTGLYARFNTGAVQQVALEP